MTPHGPLTVYFDGNCPLCVAETQALKARDQNDMLCLVDCSVPGFSDPNVAAAGIPHAELLRLIHARSADGAWLRGVDVFIAMYGIAGFGGMARLWSHPWLKPLWDRAYPCVARHRMRLSRLGLGRIYAWLARPDMGIRRSTACDAQRCRSQA